MTLLPENTQDCEKDQLWLNSCVAINSSRGKAKEDAIVNDSGVGVAVGVIIDVE